MEEAKETRIGSVENNDAFIIGTIEQSFVTGEIAGETFYATRVLTERTSGYEDKINVLISEKIFSSNMTEGKKIKIKGEFQSGNIKDDDGNSHLLLYFFVKEIEFANKFAEDKNNICLNAYICKPTVYRKTPLGREITDMMVAVHRPDGESDYIPCIAWNITARRLSGLKPGGRIRIVGRMQSREYFKTLPNGDKEKRVAYEVSIKRAFLEEM